jgi:hypothetical protein
MRISLTHVGLVVIVALAALLLIYLRHAGGIG